MSLKLARVAVPVVLLFSSGSEIATAKPSFVAFEVSGSGVTDASAINGKGDVTGSYYSNGTWHGFIRKLGGMITTFDVPRAGGAIGTNAVSINNSGAIVGFYTDRRDHTYGFLRTPDGSFSAIDPYGSKSARALSINSAGATVGTYFPHHSHEDGFLQSEDGGVLRLRIRGTIVTDAVAINDSDTIAGVFFAGDQIEHGFLRASNGKYLEFDPPNSTNTAPSALNSAGIVSGDCSCGGESRSFERFPDGTFVTFRIRNSNLMTSASINGPGYVTGTFRDSAGTHGYFRAPGGEMTTFDVPESGGTLGTIPVGINDNNVIAGYFSDDNNGVQSFIRTP